MMDQKQLQHLFIDLGIADAPFKRISAEIKKTFHVNLSPNYTRMIVVGQRTGYRYRPMIAKVLRLSETKIFASRKKRRRTDEGIPRSVVSSAR
jgi:hypothetical protein